MIFAIELKKYEANTSIFGIIVGKFRLKKKLYLIILLKVDKDPKLGFYYAILSFSLVVYL